MRRRHYSAKAQRRRAELKLEKAKVEAGQLLLKYLRSEEGQQLASVIKAFEVVAKTEPKIASTACLAFMKQHAIFGRLIRELAARKTPYRVATPTADEVANDTRALEDFRAILVALPSGKATLAASNEGTPTWKQ